MTRSLAYMTAGSGIGTSLGVLSGVNAPASAWLTLIFASALFGRLLWDLWKLQRATK